jgi:hypothetical protein
MYQRSLVVATLGLGIVLATSIAALMAPVEWQWASKESRRDLIYVIKKSDGFGSGTVIFGQAWTESKEILAAGKN